MMGINWFEGAGGSPQIHRKITLSETDRTGLSVGGKYVKGAWFQMVKVWSAVADGKLLPKEERIGAIALAPLELDYASLGILAKQFLPKIFLPNPTMLTLITNETGEHIIWAALEAVEQGVYKWVKQLDVEEKWAEEIASFLVRNDLAGAYEKAKEFVRERFGIELGLIKVARPQFFIELAKTFEASKWGKDWLGVLPAWIDFLDKVFERRPLGRSALPSHINFYPVPYCFRPIPLLLPALKEVDFNGLVASLRSIVEKMPDMVTLFLLKCGNRVAGFKISLKGGQLLIESVEQKTADELFDSDPKKLVKNFKQKFNPDNLVLVVNVDELADFLGDLFRAPVPWDDRTYQSLGKFVLKLIKTGNAIVDLNPAKIAQATRALISSKQLGRLTSLLAPVLWRLVLGGNPLKTRK